MRITTLTLGRTRSDGAYGNRSLSLSVELDEDDVGDDGDAVLVMRKIAQLVRAGLDQDEREEEEERWQREEEERQQQARRREASEARRREEAVGRGDPDDDDDDDDDGDGIPF